MDELLYKKYKMDGNRWNIDFKESTQDHQMNGHVERLLKFQDYKSKIQKKNYFFFKFLYVEKS